MWNALALEEAMIAILYEAGAADWNAARRLDAGGIEQRVRRLALELAEQGAGPGDCIAIGEAADAFGTVRRTYRNAVAHARAYTARQEPNGRYVPGLKHHGKDGQTTTFEDARALDLRRRREASKRNGPLRPASPWTS